jgi:ubiquinone/menaquinone biosynthesis C-methylase UbiE
MASPIVNRRQATAWNGPEGAHWADVSQRRVAHADLTGPLLDVARIGPADAVLDVGCGIGDMTIDAARLAPDGSATGIDLSELMIERARASAAVAGAVNASFVVGDAEVHRFAPSTFDVVVSHFGSMFFGDPLAAFTNLTTALRPGGRLALACPQAMEHCTWYVEPLAALLGARPTEQSAHSAMFSLADPAEVEPMLRAAGFRSVRFEPVDTPLWFGADVAAAVAFFVGSGPVRGVLERVRDLTAEEAAKRLEVVLRGFAADDGVRIPGSHWIVTATRAG